jgi:hypothetical protein
MLKLLSTSLILGAAIGAGCVAATSSRSADRPQARAPASGDLDPARTADRQMTAYGEAHPECRMWSNWEKLCSRTGPNGSIYCNIDPDRRVDPSAPFCADSNRLEPRNWSAAEHRSRTRYCASRRRPAPPLGDRSSDTTLICARYHPERPFNGRRVAALLRPGCEGLSDAETGRPVCVRGGNMQAGIPDCASLAASGYESDRLLVCGRWSGPASCHAYPTQEWRPIEEGTPVDERRVYFGVPDPNQKSIHGLACENL